MIVPTSAISEPQGRATKASVLPKSADKVVVVITGSVPVTADIDQTGKAGHDQHGDGQDQVDDAAVLVAFNIIIPRRRGRQWCEIVLSARVHLVQAHRAVIELLP